MRRRGGCTEAAERVYRLERRVLDLEQREIARRCREYADARQQPDVSWDDIVAFLVGRPSALEGSPEEKR